MIDMTLLHVRGRGDKPRLTTAHAKLWGLLLLIAVVAGCGDSRPLAPVQGQVLYNGKPLEFGSISFQPASGQPARADIGPDGKFELTTLGEGTGAVVGVNKVRVTCYEPSNGKSGDGEGALGRSLIPERYVSYDTSGLTVDVQPGNDEPLVIELTD